jgi:hypothetical protein
MIFVLDSEPPPTPPKEGSVELDIILARFEVSLLGRFRGVRYDVL